MGQAEVLIAGLLIRLVGRELGSHASRTEAGVLNTLDRGPRRVTELAELEGLAQPTMTQLLQKLERQGWVTRERRPEDGRFVIVSITQTGRVALEEFVQGAHDILGPHLESMSDRELAALETATDAVELLVDSLQIGPIETGD